MKVLVTFFAIACLMGCLSTSVPETKTNIESKASINTESELPYGCGPVIHDVPSELIERMRAHLAADTGVDANTIKTECTMAVTWRDGAMGCPQPGMGYTQAVVAGYYVTFGVGNKVFHYHANRNGGFLRCAQPTQDFLPPMQSDL